MAKPKVTDEDEALLDALGVETEADDTGGTTRQEERIIAGFEDIQRFVEKHGRAPQHGEERDIFERLYAVRLDRLRALPECRALLEPLDRQGLLKEKAGIERRGFAEPGDDALLEELGAVADPSDITQLRHVRTTAEKRAAEDIANRKKCEDFARFKPLFEQVRKDLETGVRETRPFQKMAEIKKGEFFIVGGQVAYVAEVGQEFMSEYDRRDSRLRVIFDNGTEGDLLLRSLQRALHRDEAGRRITDPSAGPLFGGTAEESDDESGTIYVLRSKSSHPTVAAHRDVVHKIGVTGGDVEARVASASVEATFLLAEVEVVATYKLYNINRSRLENTLHRFFANARLDIEIQDRFGNPVVPREWFLVPLPVVDQVVEKIRDNTITKFSYDPSTASLVEHAGTSAKRRRS